MEEQKTEQFLQTSLLPAILGLLEINEKMAERQSKDHAAMTGVIKNTQDTTVDVKQAISSLIEGFQLIKEPLVDLVKATNESTRTQAAQLELMAELKEAIETNTARLELLTLAIGARTEDPGITALYEKLKQQGGP